MTFMGMYLIYLALGGAIAGAFLLWAVWNDQFRDQQRARYLALGDDDAQPPPPRRRSRTIVVTLLLCGLGLASVFAALIALALQSAGGGA